MITNLRMDPYERGMKEGGGAMDFLARICGCSCRSRERSRSSSPTSSSSRIRTGSSLNAGGINYGLLRQQDAMKRLNELERLTPQR